MADELPSVEFTEERHLLIDADGQQVGIVLEVNPDYIVVLPRSSAPKAVVRADRSRTPSSFDFD